MVSKPSPRSAGPPAIRFLIRPSTIYSRTPSPIVLGARGVLRSLTSVARWPEYVFISDGFATGIIDLGGGLLVSQISTFNKIWTTYEGGPDDLGVTFFEPTGLSEGFFMLGCYCQPNNKSLHGWILVAKDISLTTNEALKKPLDYKL
ncbi:hypothetical protein A2U01_0039249, partial [Trifolium medium]|nr:hypothetical protein [Trifolium medium]